MAKKDKDQCMAEKLAEKTLETMAEGWPDCAAEQLAVDFQTIIRDAAQAAYEDAESILGELQLELDDCLNTPPE